MNNTVRDIMNLSDAYAESLAELENENWVHGTVGGGSVEFVDTARAALEAAVNALEKDAKRYRVLRDDKVESLSIGMTPGAGAGGSWESDIDHLCDKTIFAMEAK